MTKDIFISFRSSDRDLQLLEALSEAWGENQTQVLKRALEQAYQIEFGTIEKEQHE